MPVVSVEPVRPPKAACRERAAAIEIASGSVRVWIRNGTDARTIEAVLGAARRAWP